MQLNKFYGADLKYDELLKLQPKKPKKGILFPNVDVFIFSGNFAIRQIRGCWIQISRKFFKKIIAQKYQNKVFLVPKAFSFFHEVSQLDKLDGADF